MLYVVGTPIGNLDDMSIRQAKTILSCRYLLSEDTRSTGFLIGKMKEYFNLQSQQHTLISYYKEKEFEKLPEILTLLREKHDVALISEAGMPIISDPGSLLIQHVIKEGIPFTVIPGPTAVTMAYVYAGFGTAQFHFSGFLPKKSSGVRKVFEKMKQMVQIEKDTAFIFYESPERIRATLLLLHEMVPEVQVCICRELTKKFEEVVRGAPLELSKREYKGEITLVLYLPTP